MAEDKRSTKERDDLLGKPTNVPTFDSTNISFGEPKTQTKVIEVRNSMPSIPNRNRDDNGNSDKK